MKIVLKRIVEQTIEVNESDTVKSLKRMLMDKKGIPPCLQTLQLNGKDLEDERTLADCGVTEGASIELHQASGCDGGGCMQIFFKLMPDGEKIPLATDTFDMVHQIKEKLADKLGMSISHIHLVFNGKALDNHVSLAECEIVDQNVLVVEPKKNLNIVIKRIEGEPIKLLVDEYDTVKKVKERLFEITDIQPAMQSIVFNDKLLEDNSYIKECNLVNDSVLSLMQKSSSVEYKNIRISVFSPQKKKRTPLEVNPCDSVKSVTNMALQTLGMRAPGSLQFKG